jgi:hypothetical protein
MLIKKGITMNFFPLWPNGVIWISGALAAIITAWYGYIKMFGSK